MTLPAYNDQPIAEALDNTCTVIPGGTGKPGDAGQKCLEEGMSDQGLSVAVQPKNGLKSEFHDAMVGQKPGPEGAYVGANTTPKPVERPVIAAMPPLMPQRART